MTKRDLEIENKALRKCLAEALLNYELGLRYWNYLFVLAVRDLLKRRS